jgi:hypothetical protein
MKRGHGTFGRGRKIAGIFAMTIRSTASSSGGKLPRPIVITVKFIPQIAATSSAKMTCCGFILMTSTRFAGARLSLGAKRAGIVGAEAGFKRLSQLRMLKADN